MRRRFGRKRSGDSSGRERGAAIDAGRWLERIASAGLVPAPSLEVCPSEEIPVDFAVLGRGESARGESIVVGFAPRDAGDAVLATLAGAARLASEEGFSGEAIAIAPQWSIAARRLLSAVGPLPFRFRALAASSLAEADNAVEPEAGDVPAVVPPVQVGAKLAQAADRELFARALTALEGLAAKHGGAIRGVGSSVELAFLARRVAVLRAGEDETVLESLAPQRFVERLTTDGLAGAMDRLEGSLRKRLHDRRVRSGEDGLRARALPVLAEAAALRSVLRWPVGGADRDEIDLVGVRTDGSPVLGAIREQLGLVELRAILHCALALQPVQGVLLAGMAAPVKLGTPRLALAAERIDEAARRVLASLRFGHELFQLRQSRTLGIELVPVSAEERAIPAPTPVRADERREPAAEPRDSERRGPRGRSRRRGRGVGRREPGELAPQRPAEQTRERRFEEVTLFDLGNERDGAAEEQADPRGEKRPRGRRRRPRRAGAGEPEGRGSGREASAERPKPGAAPPADPGDEAAELAAIGEEAEDLAGRLAPLAVDVTEPEANLEAAYDDEEETGDEVDPELDRLQREREARRRARAAKAAPVIAEEEKPAPPPRPRRAALVAHADRDSLAAAIMLARDLRILEGIWVYPQAELMTFFRSVATDLREATPIYVVGFAVSPAHETIQAASLYRDRLHWLDHHEWPPEDREAMSQAIGADSLTLTPGTHSTLPAVLSICSRRSRFSDKFVDLVTGRFTQHDYERWGRLWWSRLGDLTQQGGDRRADLEPLLAGRPSDLAREAASQPTPPPPPEVEFVSRRDFPVVHFGPYSLVVVPTPQQFDIYLCARIARERYAAELSLAFWEGDELIVLGGDELIARRPLDLGALVDHLAAKLEWVEALPDDDHVARLRVRGLGAEPTRLDEVVSEIAMGRSILEG